jgi:rod shape-determining protein MreC
MLSPLTRLLRGNRDLTTLVICVLLSAIALALPPAAKVVISTIAATPILRPLKRLATAADGLTRLRGENERLRKLAMELVEERAALISQGHENERLRELTHFMVGFAAEERFDLLPATVIGMPGGRIIEGIEINAGEASGVQAGMPVVVPDGLVGKISSSVRGRSLVEPLTSASSAVAVTIERSRVRGIVRPRYGGASELLDWQMDYVPARSDIRAHDRVITSGLGGVYPAGLVVGDVSSVHEGPLTMTVHIDIAVNLSTIEQVFVLKGLAAPSPERDAMMQALLKELALEAAPSDTTEGVPSGGPEGAPSTELEGGAP